MRPEHWIYTIPLRLRSLFRRRRADQELDQELRYHVEQKTAQNIAKGMTPQEARRAALLEMGGIEKRKEECRDARHVNWLQDLLQDLRYGLRMLRKSPGFTAVAVLTLALGIGANTAIFSLVNAVLLRPLPYRDPGRLTLVWEKDERGRPDLTTFATYTDWKATNKSFEELALYASWQPTVTGSGDSEQLTGLRVTNNYFRTLGIRPALGRDFRPEEDTPPASYVVMLSNELWQRRFHSDPNIVGKTITLNALNYVVAGVMPADFQSLISLDPRGGPVEIWRVLGYDASLPWACRTCHHLTALARLKPGVTFAEANAEMDTISAALWKEYPKDYSAAGVILTPLREQLLGPVSTTLYVLLGAVAFVLLVACVNLAVLLMARATRREKEMAVRTALGASRSRVIRQVLTENCLLALLGAATGLIPAYWTPNLLAAVGTGDLPRLAEVRLDWHVLLFTGGLALLTGLLSGIASVPGLWKAGLQGNLQERIRGSSGGTSPRLRSMLIVSEIALSLTLLAGAGLLLRSLARVLTVSPGFDASHVLTMRVSVFGHQYQDNKNLRQFFTQTLARVRVLPGVAGVGVASEIPLGGNSDQYTLHAEGKMNVNPELDPSAERYCVSPGYRTAMGIPLLRGRDLAESDTADTPQVVLINEAAARQIWSGEDPLGKRVKIGGVDRPWWTVVGIVGDIHQGSLELAPNMQFYVPHAQWPFPDSDMTFAIRAAGPPAVLASAARQAIRSFDASQPVSRIMPLEGYLQLSVQGRRFSLLLLGAFAAIALLLSVVGIYGVTAYSVAQRTNEVGIRMALGAQPRSILWLVVGHGLLLALVGIGIGVAAALVLTRFLRNLLFEIKPNDPVTFVSVVFLLLVITLAACYIPARRAMRVDPMVALRYE
ncbi:MAG: ADOP family duplicated permease [Candidatus Acidiferrales bacterium]